MIPISTILAEVTRSDIVESCHHGNVVVANSAGKVIAYAGDPEMVTFMRSAAKPLQALNVFQSGAAEKFAFSQKELSIFCASHYGEDFHRATVQGMLDTMGYTLDTLLCGAPYSISPSYRTQQLQENQTMTTANSDCSGKHCGFLSVCNTKGYSVDDYDQLSHPMQQEILQILSAFCDMAPTDFPIGVDGCGVPVHAMPMRNMAMAYSRFANPEHAPEAHRAGCEALFAAMNAAPEMLAGTDGFCSELLAKTHGQLCGKLGAESIYCIGVKGKDLGIIVKVEDGSYRALYPAVMSTLQQLGVLTDDELAALDSFAHPKVMNNRGVQVGAIRPCFTLTYAD